jgi:hypothetical protein
LDHIFHLISLILAQCKTDHSSNHYNLACKH